MRLRWSACQQTVVSRELLFCKKYGAWSEGRIAPPPIHFMLIRSSNRREAYNAVINILLKDNRRYCNNCEKEFVPRSKRCCDNPQIGTNADVAAAVAEQCRFLRESRKNDNASTKNKSLRWGLSLPSFMYHALDNYEKKHGRRLINNDSDINWLMRNFPQFAIPRKI